MQGEMNERQNKAERWSAYYQQVHGRPPHETLVQALTLFAQDQPSQPFAIDLGCGAGRDTLALLEAGWHVLAIDAQPEAVQHVRAGTPLAALSRLQTRVAVFAELPPLPPADLVNASFSLPFCHPTHFDTLWANIRQAIRVNGRFAGQFFGENDSWAHDPAKTVHTKVQVQALLQAFEIEMLSERDEDGSTACGDAKHWHIFHVVARKRP